MSRLLSVVALLAAACLFIGTTGCTNTTKKDKGGKVTPKDATSTGDKGAGERNKDIDVPKKDADMPKKDIDAPKKDADMPKKDIDAPKKDGDAPKKDGDAPKKDGAFLQMNSDLFLAEETTLISNEQLACGGRRGHRQRGGCGHC
jgi:hypothetical protein